MIQDMTRIGRRLIEDFLLPALNDGRYGDLLKWIDRDKCYFSIRWSHKNAAKWTLADTAVFQDWDKLKGHYHPEIKGYYMQAKQRFRAALYKLNTVRKVPCEDKHVKKYQLVMNPDKKHEIMPRKHRTVHREDNRKSIPTSVICRHTSAVPKASNYEESYSSSSSPEHSVKHENFDAEDLKLSFEYHRALNGNYEQQRTQDMNLSESEFQMKIEKVDEDEDDCSSSMLALDSTMMDSVRKTPHVPLQLMPTYNKQYCWQSPPSSHKRFESPRVLLVPTYNETDENLKESPEKVSIPFYIHERTASGLCHAHAGKQSSEGVLNLSVKSEDSENLSR